MNGKLKILILEDVPTDAELMVDELEEAGMAFVSERVATKAAFVNAISGLQPDIILSDYSLPSFDGLSALTIAAERCPDVPFIFVSGALGEEMAIDLLKKGATDYVLKNRLSRLGPAVSRALHEVEAKIERRRAEEKIIASNEMLRLLTSELVMTEERERRRIAVDLHDNIGQTLALTKIKLESLRSRTNSNGLTESLTEIGGMIDQSIQQTRALVSDLSPSVLYELGFIEAMEWLSEQLRTQYGLRVFITNNLKILRTDEELQPLLFRATRELLLNVVKHAGVKQAYVIIRRAGKNIRITVKDDGVGFNACGIGQMAKRSGGFGLLSIHERLKYLGGYLEIETEKGRGARMTLIAPLTNGRKKKRVIRHEHQSYASR